MYTLVYMFSQKKDEHPICSHPMSSRSSANSTKRNEQSMNSRQSPVSSPKHTIQTFGRFFRMEVFSLPFSVYIPHTKLPDSPKCG